MRRWDYWHIPNQYTLHRTQVNQLIAADAAAAHAAAAHITFMF
jgi:hypothetical protein